MTPFRETLFSLFGRIPKAPPQLNRKLSIRLIVTSVLILALAVIMVFAVMIYGFKKDTVATERLASVVPYPAAFVDWSPVTLRDFYFTRAYTKHFFTASKLPYDASLENKQNLDQLIDQALLVRHARKAGIVVSADEVNQAYQTVLDKNGKDEVNKVLLDLYGLSEKDFKQLIYFQVLKQKTENKLKADGQWREVQVRHLLVKVDANADQKTVDAARAKADDLLKKIQGGQAFDEVAKVNSEDVQSRDQGGELGFVSRGQTVKEFEAAIFADAVKKNALLGPIRTQYGWHIIKIEDIRGDNDYLLWRKQAKIRTLIKI